MIVIRTRYRLLENFMMASGLLTDINNSERTKIMITWITHAQKDHDKHLAKVQKEVRKDKHWVPKQQLAEDQNQENEAIKSALKTLGYDLIRITSSKMWDKEVVYFAYDEVTQ